MKIGVFAYNFPHKKTFDGLVNLFLHRIDIACIFAQDWMKLNIKRSKIRIFPHGLDPLHPRHVAERLGIPYHILKHNSKECEELILDYDLDIGVILGARILRKGIIDAFKVGIINLHPGLIPYNRGLDNVKWAILKDIPQGVTTHLIDDEIDYGEIIDRQISEVYPDDTLVDISVRLQDKEQQMLIDAIYKIGAGHTTGQSPEHEGEYFKPIPEQEESQLMERFQGYKEDYGDITKAWSDKI